MIIIITFFLLILTNNFIYASAWVKEQGEFFLSNSLYFYNAKKYYDKNHNLKKMPCEYNKIEFQIYTEYGITKNNTLTLKAPYYIIECANSENSGIGDLEVGMIHNLLRENYSSVSLYVNSIIPTGYSIEENLRLGYNRFGIEGGILYGKSFNWGYIDSGLGYRHYFGYPADQIRGYFLVEYNLTNLVKLFSNFDAQIGLNNGQDKEIGNNILLNPNYELYKIYLGTKISYSKTSLILGYQETLYGKDTGKGNGLFLGFWFSF